LTVHSSDAVEACRLRWIDGSATFTTVLSSMIMKSAKHIAASAHQRRFSSFIRSDLILAFIRAPLGPRHATCLHRL
jgi:hypothetical protein